VFTVSAPVIRIFDLRFPTPKANKKAEMEFWQWGLSVYNAL
jgi:hypothetical protein